MKLRRILPALLIAACVLLACWQAWDWEYGADDVKFVRHYTSVAGEDEVRVRWDLVAKDFVGRWGGNQDVPLYRPLVSLSLALDFWAFGPDPGTNAVINLLIHYLSALTLFYLAKRLLPDGRSALPAALLLALTPLAHENITWAVGRCGLTVLLGPLSGLMLLRAYEARREGMRIHGVPLLLVALNLMTMESALFWCLWPPVCIALHHCFHPRDPFPGLRSFARLAAPYLAAMPAYLGLRYLFLGTIAGEFRAQLIPGDPLAFALAAFERLRESILPEDVTWLAAGLKTRIYRILGLLPLGFGLLAPFHFRDKRSRRYRVGTALLLGFWLCTRIPNLNRGVDPTGLEIARDAYYCYPALALMTGLLVATNRYSLWLTYLFALALGLNLSHRTRTRLEWAARGREARARIVATAAKAGRLAPGALPLALLVHADASRGVATYHPGEITLALHPPFVEQRVPCVSLTRLLDREIQAAAWVAIAAGGVTGLKLSQHRVERVSLDPDEILEPLPLGGLGLRLVDRGGSFGELSLEPQWRESPVHGRARPVLVLLAGPELLVTELPRGGTWPAEAREVLRNWGRYGGVGASFACYAESRLVPDDPTTAKARSEVVFGRILRRE
ncbi:MAG: hypothetical protein ACE5F1_06325 [Planctomycetota bacterium]